MIVLPLQGLAVGYVDHTTMLVEIVVLAVVVKLSTFFHVSIGRLSHEGVRKNIRYNF